MSKLIDSFYINKLMDDYNTLVWIDSNPPKDANTYKVWYNPDTNELRINGVIVASGGEGDKFYRQEFMNQSEITVTHNLNKYPSVTVVDTAGTVFESDVRFIDKNTVKVVMTKAMNGYIYCN